MAKELFIRFTENIEKDLEIGTSIITTDNDRVANGLCVFYGGDTVEESIKKAQMFASVVCETGDGFVIVSGFENRMEKAGSLGTLMFAEDAEVIHKGKVN